MTTLSLKSGVRILGLSPEILLGIQIVQSCFEHFGWDCVITSGIEGKHMAGSKHYSGNACDFRVNFIPSVHDKQELFDKIKESLGKDFDIIWENQGTDSEHFHLESDPKEGYTA